MKRHAIIMFLVLTSAMSFAQDIHFSQFNRNPVYLNPALVGQMDGHGRVAMHYNTQWSVLGEAYDTYGASIDLPLLKNNRGAYLGLGLNFLRDKAGDSEFGFVNGGLGLSGILPIDDQSEISVGIRTAFVQRSMTSANLQWDSQFNGSSYDPNIAGEGISIPSFTYFDLGSGINYHFSNESSTISSNNRISFDVGFAYSHITKPEMNFKGSGDRLPAKLAFYGQGNIGIPHSRYYLTPAVLFQQQAKQKELVIGTYIGYKIVEDTKYTGFVRKSSVAFGAKYRVGDAIVPGILYELADFSLEVSYDINLPNLSAYTNGRGGFEVSLIFIDAQGSLFGKSKMHRSFM